jgi:glycine dehydrogenase subunit 2
MRGVILTYEALKSVVGESTAGLMITNPNTLGLFDENMVEAAKLIHSVDGLVYYDGANLNGLLGYARPGDMGVDVLHLNLHKTFSSPHGGGGPGAGPVCVKRRPVKDGITLVDITPGYRVTFDEEDWKVHCQGARMAIAWGC